MADAKRQVDSDPEDSGPHWAMRRRKASDDDDDRTSEEEERDVRTDGRVFAGFDDELDGVGGAPENEDDEEISHFNELEVVGEEEQVLVLEDEEDEGFKRDEDERDEEEKKEKEKKALIVPRMGAFYMHDDRFEGNSSGRRMTSGGRNLWEFKDERKWQHDKFEEMTLQESENKKFNAYTKVQRNSDAYHQGYYGNPGHSVKANHVKPNNNQSLSSRTIRGRGPVKYKPLKSSNDLDPLTGNMEFRKPPGINSNAYSARTSHTSKVDSDSLAPKKKHHHVSSSNPDIIVAKRREVQPRRTRRYFPTTALPGDNICVLHYNAYLQQKSVADSIGRDRLYTQECIHPVVEHHFANLPFQSSVQSRNFPLLALITHQSPTSSNKVDIVSVPNHVQQAPHGSIVYCPLQAYTQQLISHSRIRSQASFKASSPSESDVGMIESFAKSNKSEIAWVGDQNFTTTTWHLPGMQFSGKHLGELSEHAVDRAVARYMSQPQVSFGNSGMTCDGASASKVTKVNRAPDGTG
ncbi:hypothetical protein P3X46_019921 [Hevea brasiliensis]|uniref:Btz domain-containing protein n=1 Tax=Hevea brasiliensis TaxID=3981 RepID=A0ABQ9LKA1_HEVBR|nr:hypothetical protein P3X46_019921 [Hevea brasiliensis]